MDWLTRPESLIALFTLTVLEIVLGIDNVIFISILAVKLPQNQQAKARRVGLGLAMFLRIGLLASLAWLVKLTAPLFTVLGQEISGRDLILLIGGLFLLFKSTREIHDRPARVPRINRRIRLHEVFVILVFHRHRPRLRRQSTRRRAPRRCTRSRRRSVRVHRRSRPMRRGPSAR